MSEEWNKYVSDPRTICKYGIKCYQKNPDHHKQFKHPPRLAKRKSPHNHTTEKKPKFNITKDSSETSNDVNETKKDKVSSETISNQKGYDHVQIAIPKDVSYYEESKENREKIEDLFLSEMPADFFDLFDYFKQDTEDLEKVLSSVNLQLIGPFEMLLGKMPILDDKEIYLVHWRFFYDPPEFQSVLKCKGNSEYHIGYYRDSPSEPPAFVGSNDSSKNCTIQPMASNLFGAIYVYLQNEKKKSPFTAITCQKVMDKIKQGAEKYNHSLEEFNAKKRIAKSVTKTLHGAGIMVPYDKKTKIGYRQLVESDSSIKKLFSKLASSTSEAEKDKVLSELQPVITYASIAVDECDFGTGLECGIDMFCAGLKELEPSALSCLTTAYGLLKRDAFAKIIEAHLKYRRKGPNMSVLSEQ